MDELLRRSLLETPESHTSVRLKVWKSKLEHWKPDDKQKCSRKLFFYFLFHGAEIEVDLIEKNNFCID